MSGRYIDADALKKTYGMADKCSDCVTNSRDCQFNFTFTKMDFCGWIDDAPTADVVEVTRCKDCMHTEIDKYAPAECQNRCKLSQQYHEPTFFCKCGEPRTDLLEWIHRGDDDE